MRPDNSVFKNDSDRKLFLFKIEEVINKGFNNIEIPWQDNPIWMDLMSDLRSKFPDINLGSASVLNQKSIEDSLKLDLNFSMMRFWDRDLFNYSKLKNHLLIPGISTLKDFHDSISFGSKIIKIYPINKKEHSLYINKFNKEVSFIAAGGLSISDVKKYNSLGYKAIVIGKKGFNGKSFDPNIFKWKTKKTEMR